LVHDEGYPPGAVSRRKGRGVKIQQKLDFLDSKIRKRGTGPMTDLKETEIPLGKAQTASKTQEVSREVTSTSSDVEKELIRLEISRINDMWWIPRADLKLQSGPFSAIPEVFCNKDELDRICSDLKMVSDEDKGKLSQFLLGTRINVMVEPEPVKDELTSVEDVHHEFFNDKGQFVPKLLGDYVLKLKTFLTNLQSREVFVYHNGFYQAIGEQVIEQYCKGLLGDEFRTHRANEVIGYIRASTYSKPKEPSLNYINLENGVLDYETLVLLPHDPKFMFFQKLPVRYEPEAECPLIDKFLTEVTSSNEDKTILYEWIGYNLLRSYPIQKAIMLIGEGANGKSTFLGLLKNFLGPDNLVTKSLQDLENHRFAKSSLFGKLANICPDLPDEALKRTGTFKALTGSDPIDGERKFKDSFPFWNYAKLSFSCNKMPQSNDDSDAYFRRWVISVFPNKFEGENCDQNILEKISTPEELSGLLNIAIEGLKRILDQGGFSYSQTTEDIRADYISKSDPIGGFVLFNYSWELKKQGFKESTINTYSRYLSVLKKRGANLLDPDSVKGVMALQKWDDNTRSLAAKAYSKFLNIYGGKWIQPKIRPTRKLPFIPQERELDQLIGGAFKKLSLFLQLLKDTGLRSGEVWQLKWTDLNLEAGTIILNNPEKNGEPRILKISPSSMAMLNNLPKEGERIFNGNLYIFRRTFRKYRKRMAQKLQNPRLNRITFHTFRHWKASTEYHRTKDILHVMEMLGHRDIKTTLIYTHLVNFENDDYYVKASKTLEEDKELLEAGFEYVTDRDGVKIYRKRK
jgi:P4 family phage/plasmid primase-like protien